MCCKALVTATVATVATAAAAVGRIVRRVVVRLTAVGTAAWTVISPILAEPVTASRVHKAYDKNTDAENYGKSCVQERSPGLGLTPELRGPESVRFWFPLNELLGKRTR